MLTHPSDACARLAKSLWIGGLSREVSNELLNSRLEAVRTRAAESHGRDFGAFTITRMPESSGAWVDFTLPALAQETITVLNGSTIGPDAIIVRYSRQGELTTSAPGTTRTLSWMRTAPLSVVSATQLPAAGAIGSGGDETAAGTLDGGCTAPPASAIGGTMLPLPPSQTTDESKRKREAEVRQASSVCAGGGVI